MLPHGTTSFLYRVTLTLIGKDFPWTLPKSNYVIPSRLGDCGGIWSRGGISRRTKWGEGCTSGTPGSSLGWGTEQEVGQFQFLRNHDSGLLTSFQQFLCQKRIRRYFLFIYLQFPIFRNQLTSKRNRRWTDQLKWDTRPSRRSKWQSAVNLCVILRRGRDNDGWSKYSRKCDN